MGEEESTLVFRLEKALKRFSILVFRRLSCQRRPLSLSFNDRTQGLHNCFEDERIEEEYDSCSLTRLERTSSSRYGNVEDDVDKRAQIFIDNFRRRLLLEKQISLQLRYYRVNSSETQDEENSPCSSTKL